MRCAAYVTEAGRNYVRIFVSTDTRLRSKLIARMDTHCREYDSGTFQPDGKKVKSFPGGRFDGEIRIACGKQTFRFPYWIDKVDRFFVLLDGFPKQSGKSNQWPKKDVKRAEGRLQEYLRNPAQHRDQEL